jgi:hypothetical protein
MADREGCLHKAQVSLFDAVSAVSPALFLGWLLQLKKNMIAVSKNPGCFIQYANYKASAYNYSGKKFNQFIIN